MACVPSNLDDPVEQIKKAFRADHGGTPLGWAMCGSEHGWYFETGDYAGTVEALIDSGANVLRQSMEAKPFRNRSVGWDRSEST